jgi:hypothetical protein
MLLWYGDKDTAVKRANLEKLEQHIKQRGGCVRSIIYRDVDHTDLLGALSWWNLRKIPVIDDIVKFFNHVAKQCRVIELTVIGCSISVEAGQVITEGEGNEPAEAGVPGLRA